MVAVALDKFARDIEQTTNYPYRDGKSYVARVGFRVIFAVADTVGAIDRVIADRIAE